MWKIGLPKTREKFKGRTIKLRGKDVSFSISNDIAALLRILET